MLERLEKSEYAARVAWLRRYRNAKAKERSLRLRLAEARGCAVSIRYALSGTRFQTASGQSGIERAVERIERAEGAYLDQREVCGRIYQETLRAILKLPDAKQRRVLRLRYLDGWPMDMIAEDMGVSIPTAKRLHQKALSGLDMIHLTC